MSTPNTNKTKQAAWVSLGNLFSFMVGILSPMILSRYFDKADYGTYKQVMYVYNTLLTVFTLGLPKAYAYFIPKFEIKYSKDIIRKITRIFWILGLFFSLLLYWGSAPISRILGNYELEYALKCFSPVPLFLLPTMGLDNICASFQRTRTLAIYTIVTRIFTVGCTVLPVIIGRGTYVDAILGFDCASIFTCFLAILIKNRLTASTLQEISSLRIKEILSFSIPLLTASLWGMIISSSTQFFISRYYGNDVFADFSNGFMELPFVGMIIGAVATVLLPAFSRMDNESGINQDTLQLWKTSLIKSAKFIFPMTIYSIFFAKIIMVCMYGSQYADSSYYFIVKNVSSLFYVVPFAPIILSLGKTKEYSRVHMVISIAIVIFEYVSVKVFSIPIVTAIVGEVCNLLKIFMMVLIVSKYCRIGVLQLFDLKSLSRILICGFLAAILSYILICCIDISELWKLIISFLLFVIMYIIFCKLLKVGYKEVLKPMIPYRLDFIVKLLP